MILLNPAISIKIEETNTLRNEIGGIVLYNKVVLVGRVVKDPVSKIAKNDTVMAYMTMATKRFMTQTESDFIDLKMFGKVAEIAQSYIKKGRLVCVEGYLKLYKFEDRGENRQKLEVVVDSLKILDRDKSKEPVQEFIKDESGDVPF